MAKEDFAGAVAVLQPLISLQDRDPEVLSMLAEAQWRTGDLKSALENFEDALRLDYTDYRTHLLLAQMLMQAGKTGRALTEFELATRYGEKDPVTHYNYGLALYKVGRREGAFIEWKLAYGLDGSNPDYAAAVAMGLTGKDDGKALEFFERAELLGAESANFRNNFALLLERLGQFERAEKQFSLAIRIAPTKAEFRFNLAALYTKIGAFDKALPVWDDLLRREPGSWAYRVYRAKAFLELGRFSEAISSLEKGALGRGTGAKPGAAESGPGEGGAGLDDAFDILAMSYRGSGDLKKALFYIEKAVEISPDSVVHLNNYGVILAESGMLEAAKEQWEKVLRLDPDNREARHNYSSYEE